MSLESAKIEWQKCVVASGRNATNELYNATMHAEIVALEAYHRMNPSRLLKTSCLFESNINIDENGLGSLINLSTWTLYVTIEPCIMCMAALLDLKIGRIVFGCYNERFGGCGGTEVNLLEHIYEKNFNPASASEGDTLTAGIWYWKPTIQSGLGAKEAVMLLRRFYMIENNRAPKPKKKANRVLKEVV